MMTLAVETTIRKIGGTLAVKALELPGHIVAWANGVGGLRGRRILDFGCGSGLTAWGIAETHLDANVVGVDINSEHETCLEQLRPADVEVLPLNLSFRTIAPGESPPAGHYDFIYSWSVFEHVHRGLIRDVLSDLRARLPPGGHLFIQIAPLYFSAEGAHLWELGYRNWEHLTMQVSDLRQAILCAEHIGQERRNALLSMYETLNRVTSPELVGLVESCGLVVVRQQVDLSHDALSSGLLSAYNEAALRNYQVVLLCRPAGPC